MFAIWEELEGRDIKAYIYRPDYEPGMTPPFGIRHEDVLKGNRLAVYVPTATTYYFPTRFDIPEPQEEWYLWGATYGQEWGEIEEEEPSWWTNWTRRWMPVVGGVEAGFAASLLGIQLGVDEKITAALSGIKDQVVKLWDVTEGIRRTIGEKIAAATAAYAKLGKILHIDELRTLDQILSLTWEKYYDKKVEILQEIGKVSGELFGDVHVLNQWLSLGGMVWKDFASMTGLTWGQQDMEWLSRTNKFLKSIERDLSYYARHPERLWIRIEDALVKPIYDLRSQEISRWNNFRADLSTQIKAADKFARAVDRKLYTYQHNLPDNIEKQLGPEIKQLRRDIRERYKEGLGDYLDKVEVRLELNDSTVRGIQAWRVAEAIRVERNTRMLSHPDTLTASEVEEQGAIFEGAQARVTDKLTGIALPVLEEINMPRVAEGVRDTFRTIPRRP